MMDMKMVDRRRRTEKSWNMMHDRFRDEWDDAFRTMQDHQFRVTNAGCCGGGQVNQWFYAHSCRMVNERYPDIY